jgi:acyl transferase domain-containing protein
VLAGIASFIKVILSLQHKQLPPTLNCETPNPRFEFSSSPFYPNTTLTEWKPKEGIRRAGISSFGFGGTNAHLIISESDTELPEHYQARRISLPPIRFNRKRYWLDKKTTHLAPSPVKNIASPQNAKNPPKSRQPLLELFEKPHPDVVENHTPLFLELVEKS